MKYIKFMDNGCVGPYSDAILKSGSWLPELTGDLVLCKNGYHFCMIKDFAKWISTELYSVEVRGDVLSCDDKSCARSIKMTRIESWNERTARLFAADCAEHVLHIFEDAIPGDTRPRDAIAAARSFANGEIDAAASDAAGDAAWCAASDTPSGATSAAASSAASDAAWAAARAASSAAASAAARAAASDAEKEWQLERFMYYIGGEKS